MMNVLSDDSVYNGFLISSFNLSTVYKLQCFAPHLIKHIQKNSLEISTLLKLKENVLSVVLV